MTACSGKPFFFIYLGIITKITDELIKSYYDLSPHPVFVWHETIFAIFDFIMKRIYLDNCCFNRPFDNQSSIRVKLETDAKLYVQWMIKKGELELGWSYMIDFENEANPFVERRNTIEKSKNGNLSLQWI